MLISVSMPPIRFNPNSRVDSSTLALHRSILTKSYSSKPRTNYQRELRRRHNNYTRESVLDQEDPIERVTFYFAETLHNRVSIMQLEKCLTTAYDTPCEDFTLSYEVWENSRSRGVRRTLETN
ncbi:scarecrow-like protein 4 [Pyrus ussuriensis x Pyrus communis]|uniref:Scarecrow-like protein 4 n=1 Tax=Pyrus ussuriensis x Pyrus communis TaxID=2448454 RepID=A0A5N5H3J0_9ROSA|nr:scarecrow-like protein 4 [Pyrus ussuriensis x Pyrus communis]